jgi:putative endonuclease
MEGQHWYVYLLRGRQRRFYCGITTDLERRVWEHNNDQSRASKCAWACRPLELVWSAPAGSRGEASRIEARIKRLSRNQKKQLVKGEITVEGLDR